MVDVQTLKTLAFTFAPLLIPSIISSYRALRSASREPSRVSVRDVPPYVQNALNILFAACISFLLSSLPAFAPENIFALTSSRLQTPNDVLFTRLSAKRPNGTLTAADEVLRSKLASTDARSLYLTFGPSILAECPFCNSEEPFSYLFYAIPSILFQHILNVILIGLATSSSVAGREGSRWRTPATVVASVIAMIECYLYGSYDWKANQRITRPENLTYYYWRMRMLRGVVISVMDAGLAGLLWATSTNRVFVSQSTPTEKLQKVVETIESTRAKLGAVGIIRNASSRDESIRKKGEDYWKKEGDVMGEIMQERDVVGAVRNALSSGRVNVSRIEEEASRYAERIIA